MSETPPRETLPPAVIARLDALVEAAFDHGATCQHAGSPKSKDPDVLEALAELKAARAALESSLGAMVKDSARIDVMEKSAGKVTWATGYLGSPGAWTYTTPSHEVLTAPSLREAIDAFGSPHAAPSGETRA